jgi:hypothetical protein
MLIWLLALLLLAVSLIPGCGDKIIGEGGKTNDVDGK